MPSSLSSSSSSPSLSSSSSSSAAAAVVLTSARYALRRYLAALSLPPGLLTSVLDNHRSCDSQLWLLDNSSRMAVRDACVGRRSSCTASAKNVRRSEKVVPDTIERRDGVRRWDELGEFVTFHAHVATEVWLPTQYFLVNRDSEKYKFAVCWGGREDAASDLDRLRKALPAQSLAERACPLAARLRSLANGIRREAPGLEANDQHITVVVCTQGLPTNKEGRYTQEMQREFRRELQALSELPVKIIIRVCSDDEYVLDMFNSLDCRMGSVDVLDDFWGEAHEVYLHNPWLTYTMGMHRLRESGLAPFLMDYIDERALGLTEILMLAEMLLADDDGGMNLPNPQRDWEGFYRALKAPVEKRGKQWNIVRGKPTPWIDLKKLKSIYGGNEREARSRRPSWDHRPVAPPQNASAPSPTSRSKRAAQKSGARSFAKSTGPIPDAQDPPSNGSTTWSQPTSGASRGTLPEPKAHAKPSNGRTTWFQPTSGASRQKKRTERPFAKSMGTIPEPKAHAKSFTQPASRVQRSTERPKAHAKSFTQPASRVRRSTERPGRIPPESQPQRSSERFAKSLSGMDVDMSLSLVDILKQWSRQPPTYTKIYPLQHLLLTAQDTFPPMNPKVEPHVYFDKWKSLDKEAFSDLDGDELANMLKRAVRKAKFFLHPDKLPKDATENQTFLFKELWTIIREKEMATFK